MAKVLFKRKTTDEIKDLEVEDGALIYNTDNGKTYMDFGKKRIQTGGNADTMIAIGDNEAPTDTDIKLWFPDETIKTKASEVINSMDGSQTDLAPSVDSVKKYVDNKNTYSTEEVVIGTYLGKPLYRKVLTGMLPTGKGENSFNLSSECLIKTKYGRIKSTLGAIFELDTYYISSNAYSISSWITADEHGLKVECGANYSTDSKYEITVEYIKTTD